METNYLRKERVNNSQIEDKVKFEEIYANKKMLKHVNKEDFEKEVLKSTKPVLVDFFATWCGPCQMLGPILEQLSKARSDIEIAKIDIDKAQDLAIEYGIEVVPTMVLFKQGKSVETISGLMNADEIISKIEKYL